ncbi:MAG: DoxX family protein [Mycobacteriales bacterium]
MSPTRRLARTMLAGVFISGGVNALREPGPRVEQVRQSGLADKLPPQVPEAVRTPAHLVRLNAVADIIGGLALIRGRTPRLASLGLMTSLVPTTLVGHPFWNEKDKQARAQHQLHVLKNLAILGGLLLSATDTGGRESVPHAVGRLSRKATKEARQAGKRAAHALPST